MRAGQPRTPRVAHATTELHVVLAKQIQAENLAFMRVGGLLHGRLHAKQFRRLKKTVKRQRTILGVVMREVQRKLYAQTELLAAGGTPCNEPSDPKAFSELQMWFERAERIRTQQRHDKNKLYALHAPEVECIGKGKGRKPYEFGFKVSLAVTHKSG